MMKQGLGATNSNQRRQLTPPEQTDIPTQAPAAQNQTTLASSTNPQQPKTESGALLGLDWEKVAIVGSVCSLGRCWF